MRRLLLLLCAGALALTGCSTGADAVDVNNGGEFRFVEGTPRGDVIPEDERATAPEFQEVYADVRDEGVQFLGINVKETSDQFALAFVDSFGIEFPSLYDPRGEVALAFRDYPANNIPSTIVLDAQGRVAAVYTGPVEQEDLRAVLDLLAGEG